MNRRDVLSSLAQAGAASLLVSTPSLASGLAPKVDAAYAQAVRGTGR